MSSGFVVKLKSFVLSPCLKSQRVFFYAGLLVLVFLNSGCKYRIFNSGVDSDISSVENVRFDRDELLKKNRFDLISPTGEGIFAASLSWMKDQEEEANRYAIPAQCANNVSRVFEMAGITAYSSPLLMDMINAARRRGGKVVSLPKETRSIAKVIEQEFNGALPVGTLVSGCLNRDCSGQAGDGHISIVGDVDADDALQLYHNNWFRPENRPWRPHMIPLDWYQAGYLRKWMPTPWLNRSRSSRGELVDVGVILPEIDDLDPTNYFVTLTVIPEVLNEVESGKGLVTDGAGSVMPFRPHAQPGQPSQPIPRPTPPPLSECNKLKTISPTPTNLREEPNGKIICKFALGTPLERISTEGSWSKVKGVCPDGVNGQGFVLSALVVPTCE
ncbi:hypothetical protein EBU99_08855 [bacterium]|nr:hypothetical protein [bacterium]